MGVGLVDGDLAAKATFDLPEQGGVVAVPMGCDEIFELVGALFQIGEEIRIEKAGVDQAASPLVSSMRI